MIKPLTSLRFIFAFMVFVSHLSFLGNSKSSELIWMYNFIFHEGYIGVSFFFILSGFILAYNYQEGILKNQISKKTFYLARFARIFPTHVLTLIISIPLTYHIFISNKNLWFNQAITNLTLTQSYIPLKSIYYSFNQPSWSISNELFFYLVFPFLILFISVESRIKRIITVLLVLMIPLLTLIIPENYFHQIFYINPIFRVVDFIIGIVIFNVYQVFCFKNQTINYNYLEVSSVLLLAMFFLFHRSIPDVARYSFYYWLPMSYLIFAFSFQKGKISNLLSKKVFIHLGEISFGFYMFHQLVIRYFLDFNTKFLNISNEVLIATVIFSISIVVSHYSHILFEIPMNKYIKRVFRSKFNVQ